MKKKLIKVISLVLCVVALLTMFTGCSEMVYGTEADRVNHNMSKQADYFDCARRITVYNARTDLIVCELEGYISISNNINNELVVTCKTGENTYKKNYIYLNEYVIYVVEDITDTVTDPYHYKFYFHTEWLPSVEVRP